jgi:hypothetical protein
MVKDDIAVVTKALSQIDEKMSMSMRFREDVNSKLLEILREKLN